MPAGRVRVAFNQFVNVNFQVCGTEFELPKLLGYNSLFADIKAVLAILVPIEREVQTAEDHWYTLRIQPYRTPENVIEGAVISVVDITEIVRVRDQLHKANDLLRLAVVVRDSHDAITVQDLKGRTLA